MRRDDEKPGYFEGMPASVKVLAPLTVVMIAGGVFLMFTAPGLVADGLVYGPLLIMLIRLILSNFGLGGVSILSYSLEYGLTSLISRFPRFFKALALVCFVWFIWYGFFSDSAPPWPWLDR